MPGFLLNGKVVLVADHIPAARRMHADDVALVRRSGADAAVARERGEALVERIETAVLRAALVERTLAGRGREGVGLSGELAGGDHGEAENSGEGEKAHDNLLKCRPEPVGYRMNVVAVLLTQRPSRFGRAVAA